MQTMKHIYHGRGYELYRNEGCSFDSRFCLLDKKIYYQKPSITCSNVTIMSYVHNWDQGTYLHDLILLRTHETKEIQWLFGTEVVAICLQCTIIDCARSHQVVSSSRQYQKGDEIYFLFDFTFTISNVM